MPDGIYDDGIYDCDKCDMSVYSNKSYNLQMINTNKNFVVNSLDFCYECAQNLTIEINTLSIHSSICFCCKTKKNLIKRYIVEHQFEIDVCEKCSEIPFLEIFLYVDDKNLETE